jgi:glutamate/tyrosine decarboxylase-like PLP-dependent enzyme
MDDVYDCSVFPTDEALNQLNFFDEPLPEISATDPAEILRTLHQYGSPATVAQTGGRYFGFVNGSVIPTALAARWLSDTWDQNVALHVISPIASHLESICEKWLIDLLGLPSGSAAGLVSGTSTATMCGLAAGRNELLKRQKWDVRAKGLFGAPELRIVLGEHAHATVFKALSLLGFGQDRVERVPVDSQGRMRVDRMLI